MFGCLVAIGIFASCAADMQGWREKKRSMTCIHEEWICHFHDSTALHAGHVTRRRMECGILFHDRTLKINLAGDAAPLLLLLTLLPLFFRGFKRIILC
jgi:hypothetical protein